MELASDETTSSDPPLNPNQPNQRIHAPKAAIGMFDPGIAFDEPSELNLSVLEPSANTTANAAAAPVR